MSCELVVYWLRPYVNLLHLDARLLTDLFLGHVSACYLNFSSLFAVLPALFVCSVSCMRYIRHYYTPLPWCF